MSESEIVFEMPVQLEAAGDPTRGLAGLFALKSRLAAAIEATLQRYKTEGLKLPPKDQFLAKAKAFMQAVADATDIPGIGPLIESTLESAVIATLMPLIEKLYDSFATR